MMFFYFKLSRCTILVYVAFYFHRNKTRKKNIFLDEEYSDVIILNKIY